MLSIPPKPIVPGSKMPFNVFLLSQPRAPCSYSIFMHVGFNWPFSLVNMCPVHSFSNPEYLDESEKYLSSPMLKAPHLEVSSPSTPGLLLQVFDFPSWFLRLGGSVKEHSWPHVCPVLCTPPSFSRFLSHLCPSRNAIVHRFFGPERSRSEVISFLYNLHTTSRLLSLTWNFQDLMFPSSS